MQRRVALKNMAAAVGLMSLPAWASGWSKTTVATAPTVLSPNQEALLAEIVETIIPATDTPGAKELGIHQFVQKMVADCFDKKVQEVFARGLTNVEATARKNGAASFAALDPAGRTALLQGLEAGGGEGKECFGLVKGLTIRGYLTSEYVMTNLTKYEMMPGRYHGCVPVAAR
ncbi:MAG: Gluconate 2-dehydrogenase subunit 3 family protein [uncultured Cytophagales bacterium]|uniref:Gluconate 2-dehydrogenase subunit 3 family protein n=1 Tax=uncultured Cytophagales bacterium TaxID=158755 RepID=A0A6J4JAG3_9SPHI|nr:MAG: Gluconate 2-dehydrogenase subunit 3 family protein [uncultured Cytophagales bacterium]